MPKNTPDFTKKKKKGQLMCRFFGFKSCTIIWEKPGSRVKYKNALDQSDCRIFISKTIAGIKLIFCMQVHIY